MYHVRDTKAIVFRSPYIARIIQDRRRDEQGRTNSRKEVLEGIYLSIMIYLSTSYIRGIPVSMEEAAIIDGAHYLPVFWNVICPMGTPWWRQCLSFASCVESNWPRDLRLGL